MRPYHYAGAPPRRKAINEDELVRDLHRVCRFVLRDHPVRSRPPSRVREAAKMVGSPKVRVGHFGQVYKCDDRPGCVWVHHRPQGSMRVRVGFLGREHVPGARPVEADGAVDA